MKLILNIVQKCPYLLRLFYYVIFCIGHASFFADCIAKVLEPFRPQEAVFHSCRISRDVADIFGANGSQFGITWFPEGLKLANPPTQMPSKWVSSGASFATYGKPVGHKSGNQSADPNGRGEPSKEFTETHKLVASIGALVVGFGIAILAIQWATWDVVRRIFHKMEDRTP